MLKNMHYPAAKGTFCEVLGNALKPAIVTRMNLIGQMRIKIG
jgi:hypothetical protein